MPVKNAPSKMPKKAKRPVRGKAKRPVPGKLIAMGSRDGVRAFVLDQLSLVPSLTARAMFGGVGLYSDDSFFGILARDVLYLKVNDDTRSDYEAKGMGPFKPFSDRPMTMGYYAVPVDVLEDREALAAWARRSIGVAVRAARTPRKRR